MRMRWILAGVLCWAGCLPGAPVGAETRFGIRFVVDEAEGSRAAMRARLADHVTTLNRYYHDSAVLLQAEIVAVTFTNIEAREAKEILDDMRHERRGFADLFREANRRGADYTVAATRALTLQGRPGCGRAWAVNRTRAALASTQDSLMVYNPVCGAHTLAHELGHLMGLNHGHLVDGCQPGQGHASALTPYANGFAVGNCDGLPQPGEFGTIMVGGWMKQVMGNDKASLPLFSNPRLHDPRCGVRQVCGDPETGDEARALNENAALYASHEEPDVDTLPFADAALQTCLQERYRGQEIIALRHLACPDRGIADLTGIEQLTSLDSVDFSGSNPVPCAMLRRLAERLGPGKIRPPRGSCLGTPP
ncbi:MAG: hypothetical protein HQL91_10710 [Magnetococcales bacterium]|nr:hypothetical protein [Magnetococcales bacterium]